MSRLMAMPHLFAWVPLSVFIAMRLLDFSGGMVMEKPEFIFAVVIMVVNGISLVFDAVDTVRWCRGERDIPGLD